MEAMLKAKDEAARRAAASDAGDIRLHQPGEKPKTGQTGALPVASLYNSIPGGLTEDQRERMVFGLSRMACMMVHWFADRAFTCPASLAGTIETYKTLVTLNAHNAE